jgi:hypothetical protein
MEYTSYHSWAALSIGLLYGTPFAASTSTSGRWSVRVSSLVLTSLWPQPSRSSFSDPLVSSPSSLAPPQNGPATVFLPNKEVFAGQDRWRLHSLHRRGTCPVYRHPHRSRTSDLFFFQPRPDFGGSPVESLPTPLETVKLVRRTLVTLYSTCM